ncbi:MAG: hypothetical protein AAF125_02835 [Chloroflexota bacterium]
MAAKDPVKIGVIVGREWSWPPAFIEEVNNRTAKTDVSAEYVKIGGSMMNEPVPYRVIVDRISHEVPYYRLYLKNAALQGVKIVNDPFMWTADDKYFGSSVLDKLGIPTPKTVAMPNKDYIEGIIHDESLRNLSFPLDWEGLVASVGGFPTVLKDAHGGGWKEVYVVDNMEELWDAYNQSGLLSMILQEFIAWDNYARCMVLGQERVRIMKYDPTVNRGTYYEEHDYSDELFETMHEYALRVCKAFGYDMNTVEFAVKDGVPYAIDFMNPAPDMDINSLGEANFEWMVQNMADVMIELALSDKQTRARYDWGALAQQAESTT